MIFKGTPETGFVHAVDCNRCAARNECHVREEYEVYVKKALDIYDQGRPKYVNVDLTCRAYYHKIDFDRGL